MKIVINTSYGGFRVSQEFCEYYNIPYKIDTGMCFAKEHISNKDERLINYIETFGSMAASDKYSHLVVVDIPKGTTYRICEYDGAEFIEYRDEIKWEIAED